MREVIFKAWCDRCESLGQPRTEALHTYSIGIVKGETKPAIRVIELCDACDSAEVDILSKLLATHSIPLDTKSAAIPAAPARHTGGYDPSAKQECRICNRDYSVSSLAQHIWAVHRGQPKPPPQPTRCPDCGITIPGMGQHRSQAHGWSAIQEAYKGLIT
jgi:hypothetical protein